MREAASKNYTALSLVREARRQKRSSQILSVCLCNEGFCWFCLARTSLCFSLQFHTNLESWLYQPAFTGLHRTFFWWKKKKINLLKTMFFTKKKNSYILISQSSHWKYSKNNTLCPQIFHKCNTNFPKQQGEKKWSRIGNKKKSQFQVYELEGKDILILSHKCQETHRTLRALPLR